MRDLISRQAAIKAFYIQSDDDGWWVGTAQDAETLLNGLPTAERVGKWTRHLLKNANVPWGYDCSACGEWFVISEDAAGRYNYCPNCGARMVRGEE